MINEKLKLEVLKALIDLETIKFGKFKLTSGKESSFYIDLRIIPSYPQAFRKIMDFYVEKANQIKNFDVIAGIPTSGMVYASILAYRIQKPFIYVRKEQKNWGERKRIEGKLEKNKRVLLVDDLITTGKTILDAILAIRWEEGIVNDVVVLVDREEGGKEKLEKEGLKLHSLLRVGEILEFMVNSGKISQNQYRKILEETGRL